MNHLIFCPGCKGAQPHKLASDAQGSVLWCQTCFRVHAEDARGSCPDCHYWQFERCLNADAMFAGPGDGQCPHWRPRRSMAAAQDSLAPEP